MRTFKNALIVLAVLAGVLNLRAKLWAQEQPQSVESVRWEVSGLGPTPLLAERDALERACEQVREYLSAAHPHLTWQPDPTFLRNSGMARLQGSPVEKTTETLGKLQQVKLQVTLLPEHLDEMEQYSRFARIQDRHRWLGLVLAGMAAALVVLKVYLWLEEATRGYSTTLLRSLALILLGAVLAVMLWLW